MLALGYFSCLPWCLKSHLQSSENSPKIKKALKKNKVMVLYVDIRSQHRPFEDKLEHHHIVSSDTQWNWIPSSGYAITFKTHRTTQFQKMNPTYPLAQTAQLSSMSIQITSLEQNTKKVLSIIISIKQQIPLLLYNWGFINNTYSSGSWGSWFIQRVCEASNRAWKGYSHQFCIITLSVLSVSKFTPQHNQVNVKLN